MKNWKIEKKSNFLQEILLFWLNLYCTCSQLSFEVYMTSLAQNLKFRPFWTWKIWFLTFVIWQPVAAKVYYIEGCFWCLWNAKHQNIYPGTTFGHQVVSGPTYKAVNSSGAFWPPPPSPQLITSYQSPGDIGLTEKNKKWDGNENWWNDLKILVTIFYRKECIILLLIEVL